MKFPLLMMVPSFSPWILGSLLLFRLLILPAASDLFPPSPPLPPADNEARRCLALGDLNRDGRPDLILLLSEGGQPEIRVQLNDDDHPGSLPVAFKKALHLQAAKTTRALLVDLNQDDWPDLILGDKNYKTLSIFLNEGLLHGDWKGMRELPRIPGSSPPGSLVARRD